MSPACPPVLVVAGRPPVEETHIEEIQSHVEESQEVKDLALRVSQHPHFSHQNDHALLRRVLIARHQSVDAAYELWLVRACFGLKGVGESSDRDALLYESCLQLYGDRLPVLIALLLLQKWCEWQVKVAPHEITFESIREELEATRKIAVGGCHDMGFHDASKSCIGP